MPQDLQTVGYWGLKEFTYAPPHSKPVKSGAFFNLVFDTQGVKFSPHGSGNHQDHAL